MTETEQEPDGWPQVSSPLPELSLSPVALRDLMAGTVTITEIFPWANYSK